MRCIRLMAGVLTSVSIVFLLIGNSTRVDAVEPKQAGLNQLLVIPPETHERGLPAVTLQAVPGGGLAVDIPPTVHVHRFYYTGNLEYQGPILQGGPTVIVANHPCTGERMYVEANLPAGAPIIAYDKHAITYVFPDRRVAVAFSNWNTEKVAVKQHSGRGICRRTHEITLQAIACSATHLKQSPTVQSLHELAADGGKIALGAHEAIGTAGAKVLDSAKAATALVPGIVPLQSYAEDRPRRIYEGQVQRAQREIERKASVDVPTNR